MKSQLFLSLIALSLLSCSSKKNTSNNANLFNTKWELEQITSNDSLDILFPDEKPQITLNNQTKEVTGNSGCNGYSAKFSLNGTILSISDPTISTMRYCQGDGEQLFKQMISKVNNYHIDKKDRLIFNSDKKTVMRFRKITVTQKQF